MDERIWADIVQGAILLGTLLAGLAVIGIGCVISEWLEKRS